MTAEWCLWPYERWVKVEVCVQVSAALKPLAEEKGCTFNATNGTFSAPEPPPPDPKSKEAAVPTDPLVSCLGTQSVFK